MYVYLLNQMTVLRILDNFSTLEVTIGQLTSMAAQRKIYSAFGEGSVKVQISSDVKSTQTLWQPRYLIKVPTRLWYDIER